MLGNFRNKDTLEIFNERWKANHNIQNKINDIRKNNLKNTTPKEQARRVTKLNNNFVQRNEVMNKFK